MRLILKRLIALVTRVVVLVTLFRFASTYFFGKKAAMTVAPVVALSHGGGKIVLLPIAHSPVLSNLFEHLCPVVNYKQLTMRRFRPSPHPW